MRRNGFADSFDGRVVPLVALLLSVAAPTWAGSKDPPRYPDPTDLSYVLDATGRKTPIKTAADWARRRQHALAALERVMGPLPARRPPLEVKRIEDVRIGDLLRRKLQYRADVEHWVPAYLLLPTGESRAKRPAVLCLHQTNPFGKDEAAGVRGNPDMRYALELAQRGFITLAPDYPSFGEHKFDFTAKHGYASGTIKAVWDNIRAVDLLQSLPEVDPERIGCVGHSLGGHNAMFTAVFEPRIQVVVSSCGFTSLRKDDLPSWTGPRYMPRIKTVFDNDIRKLPFDFHEIVAALAPRPFLAVAAEKDDDFDVSGVREVMDAARLVYRLYKADKALQAHYPAGRHDFPLAARQAAYTFLAEHLMK